MARHESTKFRRDSVDPANFSFAGDFTSRAEVVESWSEKVVGIYEQAGGTITGNITVEGSIDGVQFAPIAAALTAAGFVPIPFAIQLVRIVTDTHSVGDIRATVAGLDQRAS